MYKILINRTRQIIMMHKLLVSILLLSLIEGPDKPDILSPPLDIPLILSANFGELRSGHFHSGVDFKTGGITGKKVYSAADGYIYRIAVSPTGFGKAIYIRHRNGLSTVYGHLSGFSPDIEDYVKKSQYQRQSFAVNLFPESDMFRISDGEIIGYSGNSGSSMGPHLHFEVRKTTGEKPVNPIQYYNIEDDIRPVINSVAIYPAGPSSMVNGKNDKLILKAHKRGEHYTAGQGSSVRVAGPVGFGINTHDYVNGSWNRCGVKIINLKVDDRLIYSHTIDEFSFGETRYINSHIDYEEKIRSSTYIQKTFREPNNRISTYNHLINNGITETTDGESHEVEISVSDFNNNYSSVTFTIEAERAVRGSTEEAGSKLMPYGQPNEFIRDDIKINFPANCFYDSIYFRYKKIPGGPGLLYSDIHQVHNKYIPVHLSYGLAIKVRDDIPGKLRSKLCLVSVGGDNMEQLSFAGGSWNDGFIEGQLRELGRYAAGIDTIAPSIDPLGWHDGDRLREGEELVIRINDDFSGIGDYKALIDGKWALFEWDPKTSLLRYKPDPDYISQAQLHKLELTVRDRRNNESKIKLSFYW